MSKLELQKSLEVALESFQSEAERLLNDENRIKPKYSRTKLLENQMESLAKQFLYGGYINVRGLDGEHPINRKIYFTAIEFYYHECEKAGVDDASRITDYIMYHIPDVNSSKSKDDWSQRVLPKGGLHIHQSGVDVTFEDSQDRFRASILIREFVVIENDKQLSSIPEIHSTFIKHELLEEIPIHVASRPMCIQWTDEPLAGETDIECCSRVRVPKCDLEERKDGSYIRKKQDEMDHRKWHFRRKGVLNFKHAKTNNKMRIRYIGLREAFERDAQAIIQKEFRVKEIFDSHRFIQLFTRKNHIEYVKALSYYLEVLGYKLPINTLHGHISRSLLHMSCVEHIGKMKSDTIFGVKGINAAWQRTE